METKHLFVSNYNTDTVYHLHPEDQNLERKERETKRYKSQFRNAVFQTNNDREAESLRYHPHCGRLFHYQEKKREVAANYNESDMKLVNHWKEMKGQELKSLCNDRGLAKWDVLKSMNKDQLIDLMLNKRGKLLPEDLLTDDAN